ncbi:MAG: hypothetical protein V1722_01665 [Candidatus Micrarchaeota archaeon]
MQRYAREIKEFETRGKTESPWQLFKPAHAATVKAILRVMQREKAPKADLREAKKFLATTSYDEKGQISYHQLLASYLEALRFREEKKEHVLTSIESASRKLALHLDERKIETTFARNPVTNVIEHINLARAFLDRRDVEYMSGQIRENKVITEPQRAELLRYLEGK